MKNLNRTSMAVVFSFIALLAWPGALKAESQGTEYKGLQDPFGDPSNYEFSEDEKEDKEFFHLGRYIELGVDLGAGILTGGLGKTTSPAFYAGARIIYFFDKQLALEGAAHYANHLDSIMPVPSKGAQIDTSIIPLTLGLRYYFPTQSAPKAIAVANPYLAAGGGLYLRNQNVIFQQGINFPSSTSTNNFGAYAGGGVEFAIFKKHIYMGLDVRYHFVFWVDADSNLAGLVNQGDRSGGYFTPAATLTYNF